MKEILKKDWPYLFLIIILTGLSVISVTGFRFGFFTAYDEAYMLLKLQEAYDMSCITGKSQWNLIAVHWFPYLDLTSKIYSCLATSILMWATIIVITITACILYDKKRIFKYLGLTFLVYFLTGSLSYVPMQTAVICWSFCAFMLFNHFKKPWLKNIFASICGFFLGFACFIIIPAALALLGCITIMICILYWNDKKNMFIYLGSGIIGVIFSVLYMHIFVCNINDIVDAMMFTASYIGKSGYRYDSKSFLFQYGLFIRDFIFVILAYVGAYFLSNLIKNKYLNSILFCILLIIYTHYQVKPHITPTMFLSGIVIIPFLFSDRKNIKLSDFHNADTWLYLFMFVFPFIASLGTNTALGARITHFAVAWLLLHFEQEYKHPHENWNKVVLGITILFIIPLSSNIKEFKQRDDSYHFTRGNKNFAELAITKKQKEYFDNVYDILEEYNFQPHKSVILTAGYDYCCLYAFEAINSSNYHQVQNFKYFPKEKMIEPDFIFLCKWDSIVMAKDLQEMPWGWPENFDKYYVGTPEPDDAPWNIHPELETRNLYCRKSLKTSK